MLGVGVVQNIASIKRVQSPKRIPELIEAALSCMPEEHRNTDTGCSRIYK